jgi:hypothetical protein
MSAQVVATSATTLTVTALPTGATTSGGPYDVNCWLISALGTVTHAKYTGNFSAASTTGADVNRGSATRALTTSDFIFTTTASSAAPPAAAITSVGIMKLMGSNDGDADDNYLMYIVLIVLVVYLMNKRR